MEGSRGGDIFGPFSIFKEREKVVEVSDVLSLLWDDNTMLNGNISVLYPVSG